MRGARAGRALAGCLLLAGCDVDALLGSGDLDASTGSSQPGAVGAWTNVTPDSVNLDPNSNPAGNYGVQDVVADPARPSDLYAFICYQGVWRSTDYGLSWSKVSTGTEGSTIDTGRPWSSAIEADPSRDPATPPILYTTNGYGAVRGVFKSTDGGVNWQHFAISQNTGDIVSLSIDPYDASHLLAGFHQLPGLIESTNGGATWDAIVVGDAIGNEVYPFFIDTGAAATTRTMWLTEAAWSDPAGSHGTWRTTNGGGSWSKVESIEHPQGTAQIFQAGGNVVYAAGDYGSQGSGVYRSMNLGANWSLVSQSDETDITGTDDFLYAWHSGASESAIDPAFFRAPRAAGTPWSPLAVPSAMTNGPKRAAVTRDGSHEVIVGGNFLAGIWRYVE